MEDIPIQSLDYLSNLPPEWSEDLLSQIRRELEQSGIKIVILDDDPTGTQTVHNLPVLTEWGVEALKEEMLGNAPAFFILTNSRSLPGYEACTLSYDIGRNLQRASQDTGVKISVISRSDSTLRGHFPDEVDRVAMALKKDHLPYLLIPFFLEGGRYTIDDTHYVLEGDQLVPAAQTFFARDASFGFKNSNLKLWVNEKTKGAIAASEVVSVSLDDIRRGGPDKVVDILLGVKKSGACIINAASYKDMEVVVFAIIQAEKAGREFLFRTAASFVRTRTGVQHSLELLESEELAAPTDHGGLFVIGSYVEKTTVQLQVLLAGTAIQGVEIKVSSLLEQEERMKEIDRVVTFINDNIGRGDDVAVSTSRDVVIGDDAVSSLKIGQVVSQSLIEVIRQLNYQPRYLVAKGGITSSDVATKGLGVKRAMVLGQVQPGVPVWKLGRETKYPGMSYIIYPGNVGGETGLADIWKMFAATP